MGGEHVLLLLSFVILTWTVRFIDIGASNWFIVIKLADTCCIRISNGHLLATLIHFGNLSVHLA